MSPRKLPVVSGRQIIKALEKDGFQVVGTKGSHCKLRRENPRRTVIVPLHDELKGDTLRSILRQADITAERLWELL